MTDSQMRTLLACLLSSLISVILTLIFMSPGSDPDPDPVEKPVRIVWQKIEVPDDLNVIFRTRVPKGWLVVGQSFSRNNLEFVPDPKHTWADGAFWHLSVPNETGG